jgi:probable HAF family extracellular repeat protein
VFGEESVEGGRRTFGFIWRAGVIEQLVVPQAGSPSRPRSFDIGHHVAVLAMSAGGTYGGDGSNLNFGFTSQPFFAWIPSADPYPAEFFAADNVGNAAIYGVADAIPYGFGAGAGVTAAGSNLRHGFLSMLSRSDDVGSPPRVTIIPGFAGLNVSSAALAVNAAGDVVGYASDVAGIHRAFRRSASTGTMTNLGTLGGPSSEANAISDNGWIAGRADVALGRPHAFAANPGAAMIDLGTLGGASSVASGINSAGDAVGESWTADGVVHAFLWRGGAMTDLNQLTTPGSGWVLTHASAINDAGLVAGWGILNGRLLAFVLEPQSTCYANCDQSTVPPILNVGDFVCFLGEFAAASPTANCDGSTTPPTLNVADFICFQQAFAAGCP